MREMENLYLSFVGEKVGGFIHLCMILLSVTYWQQTLQDYKSISDQFGFVSVLGHEMWFFTGLVSLSVWVLLSVRERASERETGRGRVRERERERESEGEKERE